MVKTHYKKLLASLFLGALVFLLGSFSYAFAVNDPVVPAASETATPAPEEVVSDDLSEQGVVCGLGKLTGGGEILDCFPVTLYYLVYKPASLFLMAMGHIFDLTISLSLDKNMINKDFVGTIWTLMRDLANMAFIFVLLYTGIATMVMGADWKKPVIHVIIIALFINFSLFFTKVIIDAGNIFAVGIYNTLGVDPAKPGGPRQISENLVRQLQPQSFLKTAENVGTMDAIVVFLTAGVVNIAVGWYLLMAGFIFIGRLLGFWVLMILSPIAFISFILPKWNKIQEWFDMLIKLSFVAPIFLFFLYIIMTVIQALDVTTLFTGKTTIENVLLANMIGPVMYTIVIVMALKWSVDFAKKMAGQFGAIGSTIGGAAMGVAMGGAGLVGRNVIGGAANRMFNSGTFQNMAGSENAATRFVGRQLTFGADKLRNATFDARNASLVQKGLKEGGVDAGKVTSKGLVKDREALEQETIKKAKALKLTDKQKQKLVDGDQEYRDLQHEQANAENTQKDLQAQHDREKRVAEASTKAVATIAEVAANSPTGQALKTAEKALEDRNKELAEKDKNLDDAIKALTVAQSTGNPMLIRNAQRDAQAAQAAQAAAKTAATTAKNDVTTAQNNHNASREVADLNAAKANDANFQENLKKTQGKLATANTNLETATKNATDRKAKILGQAGEISDRAVEGYARSVMFMNMTTTNEEREEFVEKVRGGKEKEPTAEEFMKKWLKEQEEKNKH